MIPRHRDYGQQGSGEEYQRLRKQAVECMAELELLQQRINDRALQARLSALRAKPSAPAHKNTAAPGPALQPLAAANLDSGFDWGVAVPPVPSQQPVSECARELAVLFCLLAAMGDGRAFSGFAHSRSRPTSWRWSYSQGCHLSKRQRHRRVRLLPWLQSPLL